MRMAMSAVVIIGAWRLAGSCASGTAPVSSLGLHWYGWSGQVSPKLRRADDVG